MKNIFIILCLQSLNDVITGQSDIHESGGFLDKGGDNYSLHKPPSDALPNSTAISRIKLSVLRNYDRSSIPVKDNKPLNVSVDMVINDMVPFDNSHMHFAIDAYLRVSWNDYRLRFNEMINGSYIPLDHTFFDSIWMPDLYFPQSKSGHIHNLMRENSLVFLQANGDVSTSQRVSVNSYCNMNYKYYPFDIQDCKLSIQSYTYNSDFMNLKWLVNGGVKHNDLHTPNFIMVKVQWNETTNRYGNFGEYTTLDIYFKLFRNLGLYILRDYFPCIMLVCMSWVSFWINHRSTPARVAFGVTTVLTVVTLTNNVKENSPLSSIFRSIDYYLLFCQLYVFGALAECAVVGMSLPISKKRHFQTRSKLTTRYEDSDDFDFDENGFMDSRAENEIALGALDLSNPMLNNVKRNTELRFSPSNGKTDSKYKVSLHPRKTLQSLTAIRFDHRNAHIVDRISRILFPVSFVLLNIVYFLFHRLHPDTVD